MAQTVSRSSRTQRTYTLTEENQKNYFTIIFISQYQRLQELLASDDASYVAGTTIYADGGLTLVS
jgi:NAD(P)-dependent dehydrogenase (short-subunit alcohol dehydrogenase family)